MKTYDKVQFSGNQNEWGEPSEVLSKHVMNEGKVEELNQHFGSTGIKYIESTGNPYDGKEGTETSEPLKAIKDKVNVKNEKRNK